MMQPRKNEEYTLDFTACTNQGEGIARLENGLTVFVRGALTGERCRIALTKVSKRCAWGRLLEVITPSPARIVPDCPHYPKCGGCQLRHVSYEQELELKKQHINDVFRRIGGLDLQIERIHGAAQQNGYRNKIQFPVGGSLEAGIRIGFFRQRSHDVIDIPVCLLQSEKIAAVRKTVLDWMVQFAAVPYDETTHSGLIRHLFCRENAEGQVLVCLIANGDRLPHEQELTDGLRAAVPGLVGVVLNRNTRQTNVILGDSYRTLWGDNYIYDTLCGLRFRLSVPSFFQVNRAQAEVLYGRALEFAQLTGTETVLDLYCGTGTITQVLATRAGHALGAEIVPEAIEDAKENARRNGITNTEFFCADAGEAAAELARRGLHPDVISVDPPRKGVTQQVIDAIVEMAPARVVYVSCDPATLARDLKLFREQGYEAVRAEGVDLFPRTGHVETVCLLSKLHEAKNRVNVSLDMDELDITSAES